MPKIFTGTSGFAYPSWKPDFYPAKLPSSKFLEHYASRLNSVEINYTFRRLASAKTFEGWLAATPAGFSFSPKAHMRITHIQKLKNPDNFTEVFLNSLAPLAAAERLGPVLFQLAPTFKKDVTVLDEFLTGIPKNVRCAFEFRNASWLDDQTYDALRKHSAALCLAESEKLEIPQVLTADFVYLRLRMPEYSEEQRRQHAATLRAWLDQGKDIYCYYKHEETPQGALYAEELLKAVSTFQATN